LSPAPAHGGDGDEGRIEPEPDVAYRELPDEDQKRDAAQKKMLKMQIAPNILLKTKGRETTNCVKANMSMKTSTLSVLPICQ